MRIVQDWIRIKYIRNLRWLFLAGVAASCSSPEEHGPVVAGIEHIIVIGVDGMSPDGIIHSTSPNMHHFMEQGAHTFHDRAVLPTTSSPNWASMITGVGPEQHGITSNDWERDDHMLPPVVAGDEGIFPTIFALVREQNPQAEIGVIYHWDGFGRLFEKSAVSYSVDATDEQDAVDKAAAYIKDKKPLFTFVHFDHVDGAGHEYGHGTPQYYKAVSRADSLIGQIVDVVKRAGIYSQTLFIITADHGGIGKGHGGETLAEIEIPFILCGKGIKKGYEIKHPVFQYDNAATVAFALGIEQPYTWIGRPVKSAFEGFPEVVVKNEETDQHAPAILPERKLYAAAGGLYVDKQPRVEIRPYHAADTIVYTTDGSDPVATSPVYREPFLLDKSAVVKARSISKKKEGPVSQAFFRIVSSKGNNGVQYSYYEGSDWHKLPDFEKIRPVSKGKVFEFRLDSLRHRPDQFAIRFESHLKITSAGEYTFYTYSDDGSKLYINNQEIVNNDGGHGALEKSGKVTLAAGSHSIKVTYFNEGGGNWVDVFFKGPGIPKQIIPADLLYLN